MATTTNKRFERHEKEGAKRRAAKAERKAKSKGVNKPDTAAAPEKGAEKGKSKK